MYIDHEIDPVLDKLEQDVKAVNIRKQAWLAVKEKYLPFVKEMILLGCDFSTGDSYLNFRIAGDKEKFLAIVRCHRRHGLRPSMPEKGATEANWIVYLDNYPVYVGFSSTVCKRVQIGTQLKEVPVFDTICESITPTPIEQQELDRIPF